MNTDNSSQSTPTMPAHYQLLSHPLVHHPESPSYVSCRDILHNSTYLLDLPGSIELEGKSEAGGLSKAGANAFFWLNQMLGNTLPYVSLTLKDLQTSELSQTQTLKDCAFVQALHDSDQAYQKNLFGALAACLGISGADIEEFIELLN